MMHAAVSERPALTVSPRERFPLSGTPRGSRDEAGWLHRLLEAETMLGSRVPVGLVASLSLRQPHPVQ